MTGHRITRVPNLSKHGSQTAYISRVEQGKNVPSRTDEQNRRRHGGKGA